MSEKKGEAKSKRKKERYTHLNAEFQRIARKDKKAFLSDQCKEIEENNRMGKTRDLFKKIRDTKGTFLLCFLLPFFSQLFVRPPQTIILLFAFLFLGDGLDPCLLYNVTNFHP